MQINVKKQIIATLDLNEDEVNWLRKVSENYLGPNPEEETIYDAIIYQSNITTH